MEFKSLPMNQNTISFRPQEDQIEALDAIATALDRDRNYVLNEAINAYLELYRWQMKHIKEGLKQASVGKFASKKEVAKALERKSR